MAQVAAYGWRQNRPVADWLFEEGYRFDFFQAVKLLEMINSGRVPIGEGSEPNKEAVRISSAIDLEFPASDVVEVARGRQNDDPAEVTVNFLSLAGALGPLPKPFTELVLER